MVDTNEVAERPRRNRRHLNLGVSLRPHLVKLAYRRAVAAIEDSSVSLTELAQVRSTESSSDYCRLAPVMNVLLKIGLNGQSRGLGGRWIHVSGCSSKSRFVQRERRQWAMSSDRWVR
jgi:hypothetical protein